MQALEFVLLEIVLDGSLLSFHFGLGDSFNIVGEVRFLRRLGPSRSKPQP